MKKISKIDFAVGGQALIEGILMRSPHFNTIAVRTPQGDIAERKEKYINITSRVKALNIPFLRGIINMFEMMFIGTTALNFSTAISLNENPQEKDNKPNIWNNVTLSVSLIFGLLLAIILFKFIPLFVTDLISYNSDIVNHNYLIYNFIDGLLKILIFVGYISLISLLPDMKRVFMYHGAEHKTIMTYENGLELTVENARNQTRFHPRCGTSFIIVVFLISIVLFTLIPKNQNFIINFAIRLTALPLIAGISYELLKISAKHSERIFFKIIAFPGLLMQRITTKEPDDQMLEVAIHSLNLALNLEEDYKNNHDIIL